MKKKKTLSMGTFFTGSKISVERDESGSARQFDAISHLDESFVSTDVADFSCRNFCCRDQFT